MNFNLNGIDYNLTKIRKVLTVTGSDEVVGREIEDGGGFYTIVAYETLNNYLDQGWVLLGLSYVAINNEGSQKLEKYIIGLPESNDPS